MAIFISPNKIMTLKVFSILIGEYQPISATWKDLSHMDQNRALTIKAFGGFNIMIGKDEIEGFDRTRLQELLVNLLSDPGQPIGRIQIAFLFWLESSQR